MINLNIEIPEPSEYVSFKEIDAVALQINQIYRTDGKNKNGFPLDIERVVDWLELSFLSDEFEEPEEVSFYAGFSLSDGGKIYVNEKHRQLFDGRPEVYSICVGHEIGHGVLRHLFHPSQNQDLPLFAETGSQEAIMLHKTSWGQYGLSGDEVKRRKQEFQRLQDNLVKKAAVNLKARQVLHTLHNKFEPMWMFRQAEHFAKCLCIPSDRLFDILEEEPLSKSWGPIYKIAKWFGVLPSTMRSRLEKLRLIEIDNNGNPSPLSSSTQQQLF